MVTTNDFTGLLSERFARKFFPVPATHLLPLGTPAPGFELLNVQTGQLVQLTDYTGVRAVVLAFTRIFTDRHYCPLCHPHITALNEAHPQFQQRGVEVLMIASTDAQQSQVVAQDLGLTVPLLSDPNCRVFRLYRLGQALGAPLPAQFIVDRAGRIRFRHLFSFLEPNASVERLLTALDTALGTL